MSDNGIKLGPRARVRRYIARHADHAVAVNQPVVRAVTGHRPGFDVADMFGIGVAIGQGFQLQTGVRQAVRGKIILRRRYGIDAFGLGLVFVGTTPLDDIIVLDAQDRGAVEIAAAHQLPNIGDVNRGEIGRQLVVDDTAVRQCHDDEVVRRYISPRGRWRGVQHLLRTGRVFRALLGDRRRIDQEGRRCHQSHHRRHRLRKCAHTDRLLVSPETKQSARSCKHKYTTRGRRGRE